MSRRRSRNSSPFEQLFEIASLVPWPVGVTLAALAFGVLHWYAGTEPAVLDSTNPSNIAPALLGNAGRQVADFFKYLLALIFLAGAATSFFQRKRRANTLEKVVQDPGGSEVAKLNWSEFEGLVAEAFRKKGFQVVERGGGGPDGGVDLELYMGSDKYLVQCKHWKSYQVGVAIVRELYGVMAAEGAVGGFVVASGNFTADAQDFAEGRSIELVDAHALKRLVGGPKPASSRPVAPASAPAPARQVAPSCPVCGSHMVERPSKRGPNAGGKFWGCSQYPKCRGTRQ